MKSLKSNSIFILSLFFVLNGFSQVNLNSSLTACYALDGSAAEPINNLTGTLSAVSPTTDRFNNPNSAYAFSGNASSRIELPNSPLLKANQVSFSAWVKFNNVTSEQFIVFAHNGCQSYHEGYQLSLKITGNGSKLQFVKSVTCTANSQVFLLANTNLSSNTWYHVGFYVGADSIKIYVNGILDASSANSNTLTYSPTAKVYLGGTNLQTVNPCLNGSMDNVRFYNRKLNGNEFNQLYLLDPTCIAVPSGTAPVVSFSVSTVSLCAGGNLLLTDLSSNAPTAWNWQMPGANPPNSTVQNPSINFPNPGTYIVSLVSSNTVGASNTGTQSIVVLPNPVVTAIANPSLICTGQNCNLFASGASNYTWSTSQNGSLINVNPLTNTTYTVNGSDANGCINEGTVSLVVETTPTVLAQSNKNEICKGQNVSLQATGANSYTWSTQQTVANITVSPQQTTIYTVTGQSNGCLNTATLQIFVSACVGLNQIELNTLMSIYPNPNEGAFKISLSEPCSGELQIFNMLSELVYTSQFSNTEIVNVEINDLAKGMYYLKLNTTKQKLTRKFLKY